MAEVFLAQRGDASGVERRVAVKRILPHHSDAPDFIQMFLGEAQLATQLGHPNIVAIYDFGKVDADYFIAMEYVDGVHAGDVIRRGRDDRMPPHLIARVGADAAAALHYVHELRGPGGKPYGLVHRDVSPANLMLSFDGVVKLCDFGIAKAMALGDRPLTKAGLVRGKYAYMSPEQTVGSGLDGRSDVYTLAIVLWELLVGETLVPRGDAVAAMRAIRHGKLAPIREAAPDAPAALADAIAWGLTTAREQRPTAAQLAQALEAFIAPAPELATPAALGGWLRARFPRELDELPGEMPASTQETPSTFSEPFAARGGISAPTPAAVSDPASAPRAMPRAASSVDPTSETFASRHVDPAAAPTIIALDGAAAPPPPTEWQRAEAEPIFGRASGAAMPPAAPGFAQGGPAMPPAAPGFAQGGPAMPPAAPGFAQGGPAMPPAAPGFAQGGPAMPPVAPIFAPAGAAAPAATSGVPRRAATAPPATTTMMDNADTLMRSGAFRLPVPSGPAAVPTLLDARPEMRGSPMFGIPAVPGHGMPLPPHGVPPPALRIGRVLAAMGGVALLSFAIVMVARGKPRNPTGATALAQREVAAGAAPGSNGDVEAAHPPPAATAGQGNAAPAGTPSTTASAGNAAPAGTPSTTASAGNAALAGAPSTNAGPGSAAAAGASTSTMPASAAPTGASTSAMPAGTTAAATPPNAAGMAVLDVHTDPAGATVLIRRCRDGQGKCSVDRAAVETPIGDCPAAPCRFTLPVGSYEIAVELDGARERRTVDLMTDVATSLDILFKPASSRRPAQSGKLTLRALRSCKATVDGHARAAPIVELELRPGPHKLELQCARRPPTLRSVTITAGKTTTLDLTPR